MTALAERTRAQLPAGRLFEAALQAIKQYILDHRLGHNDPLPTEGQLAEELGISRNSVREAIKALEALGMVETRAGVGPFVRGFSFDPILDNLGYSIQVDRQNILELLQVRRQLEAGFVEIVAMTVTPAQLRILRSTVDRIGERVAAGESFAEEDRFFHRTLYTGLGNSLLLKLLDVFWDVHMRLRAEMPGVPPADAVRSWELHRQIVEALERGDGPGARAAMLVNFTSLEQRLQQAQQAKGTTG